MRSVAEKPIKQWTSDHMKKISVNPCKSAAKRIRQRGNPDRRLPPDSQQNRLAAHPHHPGPHVRTTLQRRSCLRNAEEKDTWSDKQVCDSLETVVSHEWH